MKIRGLAYLGAFAAIVALGACSKKSDSGGTTAATTFDVSGTMGGLSLMSNDVETQMSMMDYAKYYATSALSTAVGGSGYGDNQASAASACSDGKYYRVLCSAWSNPPVSQYGDVSCSGAASGSFTVAGLPLGSDISCFVQRSTTGSSFKPFATLEIPAASIGGSTDTMTPSGNVALSVSVSSTGTVTTSITSGASAPSTTAGSITTADFSGYWGISCNASTDATENIRCKCMMGQNSYNGEEACIAAGAAAVTAPSTGSPDWGYNQLVDTRVYTGTVGSSGLDTNGDGTADLASGSTINGISVWGATCSSATSCTSLRVTAGGDSLPTFGSSITWTGGAAITWPTADINVSGTTGADGTNPIKIKLTANAIPADNATQATWLAWLTTMVTNANWNCVMGSTTKTGATAAADGFCVSNFVWQVLEQVRNTALLPKIAYRHQCSNWSSCTLTPSATYMEVEGIKFSSGNADTANSMGKTPAPRFVLEQFIRNSSGGGGFKQKHEDTRWVPCVSSGTDSSSGVTSCPGSANGIECSIRQEMAIKFIPSGTAGSMTAGFSKSNTVSRGVIRGGSNDGSSTVGSFDAYTKCVTAFNASGGTFTAKFTRLAN